MPVKLKLPSAAPVRTTLYVACAAALHLELDFSPMARCVVCGMAGASRKPQKKEHQKVMQLSLTQSEVSINETAHKTRGYDECRREFVRIFNDTARYHHRFQVFRDFVEMAAIAVQNAFIRSSELEERYLSIVKNYETTDAHKMAALLGCLVQALTDRPGDFLGQIFMDLEISSSAMGQVFTPYEVSRLMAQISAGNVTQRLEHEPYITLHEPAVGAGSMVIAFAEAMADQRVNYQKKLFASCVDIDPVAVHMCYLQLSLLGVPAEVTIGNTLTLQFGRTFRTPLWYIDNWAGRLSAANTK
ncbi:N-6 DNA methylase [Plesiomonas sp. ZOR0011]|uniref:N-6 DNA methylase n=1 Tax=Plesiomonas sp. ZOR0011 TaxID=1339230 RepID=UPI000A76E518|nr:N-6 DNA methylase [Plesiomonas sp. ZOR0011]